MHRRHLHWLLAFAGLLGVAVPGFAGVYNTAETDEIHLSADFDKFRDTLKKVQSIGLAKVDFDVPLRKRYLLWEALGGKNPPRDMSLEESLNYSAVLIRRKSPEAVPYVEQLNRKFPDNLLLQSHLAHAYWTSGAANERRAIDVLHQLLNKRGWPEHFADMNEEQREFFKKIGWSEHPTDFYRQVEGYLLKLMRLRSQEPVGQPFQSVDALFDGGDPKTPIKFVNDKGVFEPGHVSKTELKKLPPNARDIVQQLLLWLPEDLRLYWLLGELYHADGNPQGAIAAKNIFDELVYTFNLRAPDLRERRQRLGEYVKTLDTRSADEKGVEKMLTDEDDTKKPSTSPLLPMSPRTIAVTFASGFIVGLFALWQFQELRRRRRAS